MRMGSILISHLQNMIRKILFLLKWNLAPWWSFMGILFTKGYLIRNLPIFIYADNYVVVLRMYNLIWFMVTISCCHHDLFICLVYSFENRSAKSRHAYSLHVVDTEGCKWAQDNWLVIESDFVSEVFLACDSMFLG